MNTMHRIYLATIASAVAGVPLAAAQDDFFSRDRNIAVQDRNQPEFDPEPIRLGSTIVDSRLLVGAAGNTNVFATPDNTSTDVLFRINPRVAARTDWSRHQLGAVVDVERRQFVGESDESVTNIRSALRGRLDVGQDYFISADAFARRLNIPRQNISVFNAFDEPVQFTAFGGSVSGNYERSRIAARLTYSLEDQNFQDATTIAGEEVDQDFRDNLRQEVEGRVAYAVSRDVAIFGQAAYNRQDFDILSDFGGVDVNRDSTGYNLQAGLDFELEAPFRGEVAVGYLEQNRVDPGFADLAGISVDAQLQWFPTQLTTVTLNGSRDVIDTGLGFAAGAIATSGGLRVDHELLRNVVVGGFGNVIQADFEDIARDDLFFDLGASVVYKLNKRIHLEGFYNFSSRDSDFQVDEFDQSIFGLNLIVYP